MASIMAHAQYQLPNPGFEQWNGGITSEPAHWNSFATSDGSFASLASSPHHYRRNGGRPGTQGSHYLTIYTKSIMGIKANGNMTTGRIHAGSMTAASSDNYNYTQRSNADHCQPFTGTPDSMYIWVSFYAKTSDAQAQVSAILHGNNNFRSPNQDGDASLYCGKAVARFTRTTSSDNTMQWQQIKVPFVYDGQAEQSYMLFNITTNATPGSGDGNDSLSIDDIEFIYSSWLNGISVAGVPVNGFSKTVMDYIVRVEDASMLASCDVAAIPEAEDAAVSIERNMVDDTTALVTIIVTAEDGVSTHTYSVTLTTSQNLGVNAAEEQCLVVYPNPTSGIVCIEADGEVCLYDMVGHHVMSSRVHGRATFDLSSLPAGTYLFRYGNVTRRLIVR